MMTYSLSARERKRYQDEGYLSGLPVLDSTLAESCCEFLMALVQQREHDQDLVDQMYYKSHLVFKWLAKIALNTKILDRVESLLGPDILLWNSCLLPKAPNSDSWFTWHQDATYWELEPPHALTVWLAFGEVTKLNGAMKVIPGSHASGQLRHENTFDPTVMLPRGQKIVDPLKEEAAKDIVLRPGEMSIHGIYTVHGSGPNRTERWRLGCNMTFVATDVHSLTGRESAVLVRGQDSYGNFEKEPWPDGDRTPEAIAAHAAAMARMGTRSSESTLKKET